MTTPRDAATACEHARGQIHSHVERFSGYGIMGLPFRSGHVLGMRRFPVSSVGPGYTSVWHRDPDGVWTFYTDAEPLLSCNRYFGRDVTAVRTCAIQVSWPEPFLLRVDIPGELAWGCRLTASVASRAMNAFSRLLPSSAWNWRPALSVMGMTAGLMFRAGRVRLYGRAPNGQAFIANPRILWLVRQADAEVRGAALGAVGPLDAQARLGDFWIPQRGLFVVGGARFEAFDASRHVSQATVRG